ncbi:ChrR family anti-sigma-E factor [Hellea balneolensis]|uniref:ChrR family anti-sigma-E factor n=1 Tax=Hellea balneolensis TaxID=287478 RepID=UPI000403618E|nr:ChrR family anti-sigma-E factor [Hellea balneolensis]
MTLTTTHDVILSDDVITDYAIGALSPAKHVMLACQSEISQAVSERVAFQEDLAASMLEDGSSQSLSPLFMGNVLANLPPQERSDLNTSSDPENGLAPKSLRHMLGHGLQDMNWKSLVPGVAVHDIMGDRKTKDGDRLYLLKAKGGMKMPEHSHNGEEWTLILTGSYTVGEQLFTRGDMHIEDESETHSPHIDEGEDCICLVMTQGPLKMQGWLPKVVQRVVGI